MSNNVVCATSKGSDQSAHTRSLLRAFASRFNIILSVNEKLPVLKFRYFGKYIIQLFGYCIVHVSGQREAGLDR